MVILEKDITLTWYIIESFCHEVNKTKNMKMHHILWLIKSYSAQTEG